MRERPVPLDVFVGRVAELAQVAGVAALAATGQPWLVSIHGDPGTGKTSLARRGLATAGAGRVRAGRHPASG